jgi:hypothetical protein
MIRVMPGVELRWPGDVHSRTFGAERVLDPPATGMCRLPSPEFRAGVNRNESTLDHRPTRPSRWLDGQNNPLL